MRLIIEKWKELFSSKKKILRILEEIREIEDADRVVIYTLGNKTCLSSALTRSILYEVTRGKEIEKLTENYSERLLDEQDFHLLDKLLSKQSIFVTVKDVSPESAAKWENMKIVNREVKFICINKRGNFNLIIDNPNQSLENRDKEVFSKINELKCIFD